MPLPTKVGLGPGHIMLHGDLTPLKRGTAATRFSGHVSCDQTAGWIKMPLGMDVGLGPGHTVLDGDPPPKGHSPRPNFRPMSVAVKRLYGSRCHLIRTKASARRQCEMGIQLP